MGAVHSLFRYPVKGLSGEPLASVDLIPGKGIPSDRRYAVTNGSWTFDAATFAPRPKTDYLVLLKYEALAALSTTFLDESKTLVVKDQQGRAERYFLGDPLECARFAERIVAQLGHPELGGPPSVVEAEGIRFTDVSVHSQSLMNAVSLINLASVRDLSRVVGVDIDPLRFRANIYFDNDRPWSELDWLDQDLQVGPATLRLVRPTRRCAATNVNPRTAQRDLAIPTALSKNFGHILCGVYGEVRTGGMVQAHDSVTLLNTPSAS